MEEVYIGLLAFLVSAALIVLGCNIGVWLADQEKAGGERTTEGHTSNPGAIQTGIPAQTTEPGVLQPRRLDIRTGEFRGFHSPPGRF